MSYNSKYPPKFSQDILYPAIYDLDKYDIPPGNDFYMGTYFNIRFGNDSINDIPELGFGKHKFDIFALNYDDSSAYSPLKSGTRVKFELKDSAGTVVFSDMTRIYTYDGFTGYVWIKQDPVRTFNDIQEGQGTFRIVAKANTTDPKWRNRYNVRVTHPVDIKLYNYNQDGIPTQFFPNESPLILQKHTGSLGSGSGNFVLKERLDMTNNIEECFLEVTASNLQTYSGQIKYIRIFYKLSGSVENQSVNPALKFEPLTEHTIEDGVYEDNIHSDWSAGINPQEQKFIATIEHRQIPLNGWDGSGDTNKVKFKFLFKNPVHQVAKDYHTIADEFEIIYPKYDDEWMEITGQPPGLYSTNTPVLSSGIMGETGLGPFNFTPEGFSRSNLASVGFQFDVNGKPYDIEVDEDAGSDGSGGGRPTP